MAQRTGGKVREEKRGAAGAGQTAGRRPGRRGKRETREAAVEARRALVAQGLLARKTIRQIAADLEELPPAARPAQCSPATIGRDALALRAEWARARAAAVEARLAEDWARLAALEQVWWPKALAADAVATDKVLAIQRQRAGLLAGKGVRQIAAELADLPPEARPPDCSRPTIGRDALRLRAEWAQARAAALEARLAAPAETPGQARVG